MTIKTTLSIAAAIAIGIQTAHANNVVVDMSQVQDYNQSRSASLLCRISRTRAQARSNASAQAGGEELHARTGLQRSELKAAYALARPLSHCPTHLLS